MKPKNFDPIPLTAETLNKAKSDLHRLEAEEKQILVRLQTAREMGDLSENGAYKYAKFELGNTRRKLRQVRKLVRFGYPIKKSQAGSANFGSSVVLKNSQQTLSFTLVSKHESDPSKQKLSTESPIGCAVYGKKQGDRIQVKSPAGTTGFTITKIT